MKILQMLLCSSLRGWKSQSSSCRTGQSSFRYIKASKLMPEVTREQELSRKTLFLINFEIFLQPMLESTQDDLFYLFNDPEEPQSNIAKSFVPIKIIGQGSFSIVLECIDVKSSTRVAIKIVNKKCINKGALSMLLQESSFLQQLNHQKIVGFIDSIETASKFYLILELVQGQRLTSYLETAGKLSEDQIRQIISQILEGLEYCHKKGIIHRDLKPDNIIIQDDNEQLNIKIIDFGLSFQKSHHLVISHQNCGTLKYMAPETLQKQQYNQKVDIWSLGIIVYYLFSGGGHPMWDLNLDSKHSYILKVKSYHSNEVLFPETMSKYKPFFDNIRNAINFFQKTVDRLPENRMSASQALQHPWLVGSDKPIPMTMSDVIEEVERIKRVENRFKCLYFLIYLHKISSNSEPTTDFLELDERLRQKQNELQEQVQENYYQLKKPLNLIRSRKLTMPIREISTLEKFTKKIQSQKILSDDSPRLSQHRINTRNGQERSSINSTKHSSSQLFKDTPEDSFRSLQKLSTFRISNLSTSQKASSPSIKEFNEEQKRRQKLPQLKTYSKFKIEFESTKKNRFKTENLL